MSMLKTFKKFNPKIFAKIFFDPTLKHLKRKRGVGLFVRLPGYLAVRLPGYPVAEFYSATRLSCFLHQNLIIIQHDNITFAQHDNRTLLQTFASKPEKLSFV